MPRKTWELVDEWADDGRKVRLEVRRDGHRIEEFREVWPLGEPLPVPSSLGKRIRELTRAKGASVGEVLPGLWSAAIVAGQRLGTTAEYQMLAALEATGERAERALERLRKGDAFLDPLTDPPPPRIVPRGVAPRTVEIGRGGTVRAWALDWSWGPKHTILHSTDMRQGENFACIRRCGSDAEAEADLDITGDSPGFDVDLDGWELVEWSPHRWGGILWAIRSKA